MSVVSSTYLCTKQSGLRSLISTKNELGPNQEPRLLMFMFNKNLERKRSDFSHEESVLSRYQNKRSVMATSYGPTRHGLRGRWMAPDVAR